MGVGAGYDVQVTPGVELDVFVSDDVTALNGDVIGSAGINAVATQRGGHTGVVFKPIAGGGCGAG